MEEKNFYFITVFAKYDDRGPHNMRCWGFYDNFNDADQAIRGNFTDMWETIYDFAVIEEYLPGISGYNFNREFYKYNINEDIYEPIDEPEELKHYVSFAIG